MKTETQQEIKRKAAILLQEQLNRAPTPSEIANVDTDSLILIRVLTEQLLDLTERVIILEKK